MQGLRVGCLFRILFLLKPNITSDIINSEEFLRFLFYSARYFLKTKYTKQGCPPVPAGSSKAPFGIGCLPFGCPFLASRNPDPIRIELKRLLSAGTASKLFPSARGLSVFALRQAKIKQNHRGR